jgi:hypothetical protein
LKTHRRQLDNLLLTYNLKSIVNFPTRISNSSTSALDNFFVEVSRFEDFSVILFGNDLSDHEAQILTINISAQRHFSRPKFLRRMDKFTIPDFVTKLSNESWEGVFNNDDVNLMFNYFLNIYLKIFHSNFPLVRAKTRNHNNNLKTLGIKTLCKRKRELFIITR